MADGWDSGFGIRDSVGQRTTRMPSPAGTAS
ncbi:hypothetical protein FHY13_001851 [Xanthomonas arboricola]|nr:hypothetical protein [Xanthomonas euroxanthea]